MNAVSFKKLRGVNLPEEKQGLIRYTCLTYPEQPRWVQNKIERLCAEQGGFYTHALREVMCGTASIASIAQRSHVDEKTLYALRKAFYEAW